MTRKLNNWVEGLMEYTECLPSPEIFRRWVGIAAIAGALERKVWVDTMGKLYPNMYTILVAPPGVGKSILTSRVEKLWGGLDAQCLASSSVTKASLIDDLHDAVRTITVPKHDPPIVKFHSLKIASNELGVLLPAYENDFMNVLTDIYDGSPYSERRRSSGLKFKLEAPQLNLLAATTPSYLNNLLPDGAWDQGFLSRSFLIYSGERILRPVFGNSELDPKLWKSLQDDLKHIGKLFGEIEFSEEAAVAITAWHMAKGPPAPDHPKLQHYLTRRTAHLLKLCMVACVSAGDRLVVDLDMYKTALDWLVEAEFNMPDIFKSMASGGDAKAIEECWYFCMQMYSRKNEPIPQSKLYQFLQARVPSHNIERIIEIMVKAAILQEKHVNKIGKCYIPVDKVNYG